MKKIFALILCAMLCLSLCACGGASDKQTLTVGFDAEFPPFGFMAADGSYDGFDLAMARELCKRLGWEYKETAIDWNSKDSELSSGNINCIWNGFTCTGREEEYTWSDPYVDNSIVLGVKKDSGIASKADLAGKTVMVQAASSAADAINGDEAFKSTLKDVIELDNYNTGFMELKQGTVDAIAADQGVAAYQIANNEGEYCSAMVFMVPSSAIFFSSALTASRSSVLPFRKPTAYCSVEMASSRTMYSPSLLAI